jgi:hypothetical protein
VTRTQLDAAAAEIQSLRQELAKALEDLDTVRFLVSISPYNDELPADRPRRELPWNEAVKLAQAERRKKP